MNLIGNTIDVFRQTFGFSPYTFGYNGPTLKHYDHVLVDKEDYGSFQTLDYIFEIKHKNDNDKSEDKVLLYNIYIDW